MGFDWLVVDTEHGPAGLETVAGSFQAMTTTDAVAMARIAWNDPELIKGRWMQGLWESSSYGEQALQSRSG